ncbi:phosphatase PAP2 family protein [Enterovibrio nigricans]|uniref:undecaprenyl-diphosphate phosphatase n=1 Tax=Enterovibrio nigricans DSM 22720 TaxID=1121868 RepID=A0A1T4U1R6_9GAMM|nr:phosphatase PAP2 family protein [Enterovibrio nigricans]PKF51164.1 phosphatase PAP2 family protein [Enterovibrio nigricans]SKA46685.1 undecaprenyl-diphosphatase [Enterovibrio nigricans DSM 22720]
MRSLVAIQRVDHAFSTLCLSHRFSADIARIFRWVSKSGDGHLYAAIGAILAISDGKHGLAFLACGLMAFSIEVPIYMSLKRFFRRARPQHLPSFITPSDLYSMPSGHTAAAFVMAALLSQFYPEYSQVYWTWAIAIGLSRVLLGVHFISDVLVGVLLGLGCAALALSL